MRELRVLLAGIPGLFYFAVVFTLLALWVKDPRGISIAAICAFCGVLQLVREDIRRRR